jgi:hypothetical protein
MSGRGQGRPSSPGCWCGRSTLSSGNPMCAQAVTLGANSGLCRRAHTHVSPELALRAFLLPALAKHGRCDVQRILISLQLALRLFVAARPSLPASRPLSSGLRRDIVACRHFVVPYRKSALNTCRARRLRSTPFLPRSTECASSSVDVPRASSNKAGSARRRSLLSPSSAGRVLCHRLARLSRCASRRLTPLRRSAAVPRRSTLALHHARIERNGRGRHQSSGRRCRHDIARS